MIVSGLSLAAALLVTAAGAPQESNNPFPFLDQSRLAPAVPGDPAEALAGWLRVLGDNPNDLNALEGAGRAALLCGDPSSSIGFWARADRISPNDGTIKAGLARALVQAEQPKLALTYFDRAVALGVPEEEIAADRGLAFDLTGNGRRAQHDYALALKGRPDPEVVRRLALSQAITGDRATALATLDPLLRKQDPAAWRARAFVRAITGDVTGADADARAVLPMAQATQIAPFLARLSSLTHEQQASAVTFGDIPSGGRPATTLDLARAAEAPLPRPSAPAPMPAPARTNPAPVLARNDVDFAGRALGGGAPVATQALPRTAAPVSSRTPAAPATATITTTHSAPPPQPIARATLPPSVPAARPALASAATPSATPAAGTRPIQPSSVTASEPGVTSPFPQPRVALAEPTPSATPAAAAVEPSPAASDPLAAIVASVAAPTPVATTNAQASPAPAEQSPSSIVASPEHVATSEAAEHVTPITPITPIRPTPAAHAPEQPTRAPVRTAERGRGARTATGTLGDEAAALGTAAPSGMVSVVSTSHAGAKAAATTLALADLPSRPGRGTGSARGEDDTPPPSKRASRATSDRDTGADTVAGRHGRSDAASAKPASAKVASAKPAPERIWVQVAGGANKHDLPKAWSKLKQAAPDLFAGRTPSTVPFRFTNRLLIGPFKDEGEAQAYVNRLTKGGQSGFIVRTPGGQKVDGIGGD